MIKIIKVKLYKKLSARHRKIKWNFSFNAFFKVEIKIPPTYNAIIIISGENLLFCRQNRQKALFSMLKWISYADFIRFKIEIKFKWGI